MKVTVNGREYDDLDVRVTFVSLRSSVFHRHNKARLVCNSRALWRSNDDWSLRFALARMEDTNGGVARPCSRCFPKDR